jgi:hypothetical protein
MEHLKKYNLSFFYFRFIDGQTVRAPKFHLLPPKIPPKLFWIFLQDFKIEHLLPPEFHLLPPKFLFLLEICVRNKKFWWK